MSLLCHQAFCKRINKLPRMSPRSAHVPITANLSQSHPPTAFPTQAKRQNAHHLSFPTQVQNCSGPFVQIARICLPPLIPYQRPTLLSLLTSWVSVSPPQDAFDLYFYYLHAANATISVRYAALCTPLSLLRTLWTRVHIVNMYLPLYMPSSGTCTVQYQSSNFPLDARTGLQSIQSTNALVPMSRMMYDEFSSPGEPFPWGRDCGLILVPRSGRRSARPTPSFNPCVALECFALHNRSDLSRRCDGDISKHSMYDGRTYIACFDPVAWQ